MNLSTLSGAVAVAAALTMTSAVPAVATPHRRAVTQKTHGTGAKRHKRAKKKHHVRPRRHRTSGSGSSSSKLLTAQSPAPDTGSGSALSAPGDIPQSAPPTSMSLAAANVAAAQSADPLKLEPSDSVTVSGCTAGGGGYVCTVQLAPLASVTKCVYTVSIDLIGGLVVPKDYSPVTCG